MKKVVKCSKCGQHFMRTEKDTKCPFPFCRTEYVEVDPVRSREGSQRAPLEVPAQAGAGISNSLPLTGRASASNGVEEKASAQGGSASGGKEKNETAKIQKKSFKIWKNN